MKRRLFTPGPTPVPEHVMLRMAQPLIHHRSPEFREMFMQVNDNLRYIFQTSQPVITLTASGTGAMEAAVTNLFSPGETMVYVNGGKFGERWGAIAQAYGVRAVEIAVPWGTAVTAGQIENALKEHSGARAVMLTHSETSTGVFTDVRAIGETVRANSGALLVVDGITSLGAHELRMDAWSVDCLITGSQKGLMIPPGLAFIALSSRAWERAAQAKLPKFYFDLLAARAALEAGDTAWTPAISLIIGLDEALQMMRAEGIESVWRRHERLARAVRSGCAALGLKIFGAPHSHAVTAVWLPESPDGALGKKFLSLLKSKYGVTTANGQGAYKGKIFRISHLGYYDDADIAALFTCMELALAEAGYSFAHGHGHGAGVAAAQHELMK